MFAAAPPWGGLVKCVAGSETAQKMSPIPIPAWKSIANHAKRPNSGSYPSPPSRILPKQLKAR